MHKILFIFKKLPLWVGIVGGLIFLLAACSTTSNIADGEQLFIGLKSTEYRNYERNNHFDAVKEEMEMVLATQPNGALFGSSSVRSPFPVGLWIWNAFSSDSTGFARWMTKSFGKRPVLMTTVNPPLHALVGESTLKKRGYFDGRVTYETIQMKNPKKAKVAYTVDMGHLWTVDSMSYVNFPTATDSLIEATLDEAYVKRYAPFDVATLEEERQRITNLFRDHGYFFYEKNNSSYLADTVAVPGKVQLRLQMVEELKAGTPYIIKWASGDNIVNPQFIGVTIDATDRSFDNGANGDKRVRFIGVYKSIAFDGEDKSVLLLGGGNTLYHPVNGAGVGALHAYFKIGDSATKATISVKGSVLTVK